MQRVGDDYAVIFYFIFFAYHVIVRYSYLIENNDKLQNIPKPVVMLYNQ